MSQMKPAREITSIKIGYKDQDDKISKNHFMSKKEFIVFDGFLKAYNLYKKEQVPEDEEEENTTEEEKREEDKRN